MKASLKIWTGKELYLVLIVAAIALYVNLGGWGVTETSEARYAEVSYEMYQSGDYLHPRLLGIQHYHKPPMIYWVTALSYHLWGPTAFAARFFLQIAVLLQIILVYNLAFLFFERRRTALLSVLFYISFTGVIISSRVLTTDAWLNTFILAAIYFQAKRRAGGKAGWFYAVCLMLGLGYLTKGPVVFVLTGIVFPFINYHWPLRSTSFTWHNAGGIVLFLIIAMPWFVYLIINDPRFFDYFIIDHTINRFATRQFGRYEPFWYFIVLLPAITAPWFFLNVTRLKDFFQRPLAPVHILWIWVGGILLFFSLSSSKLMLYILPVLPAIAILAALNWEKLPYKKQVTWNIILGVYHILVLAALFLSPFFFPGRLHFNTGMWATAGIMAVLLLYQFHHVYAPFKGIMVAALFTLSITGFSTFFLGNNPDLANDTLPMARFVEKVLPYDGKILAYNKILPSLAFNTKRMTISVDAGDKSLSRETMFEEDDHWQKYFIDAGSALVNGDHFFESSVLVVRQKDTKDPLLNAWVSHYRDNKMINGWIVYYNPI